MGQKVVCLNCKKSYNTGTDFNDRRDSICPECGKPMIHLPHRFRPPKKTDSKKWDTVKYLIGNGFYYQHIYEIIENEGTVGPRQIQVDYPENIKDAQEFVLKYKDQARK